jgi:O-methyltransferase involved in polyketide biosynthesis
MTVTIDHLTPVEKTLLITLTGRALDARTKRPLLGDRLAAKAFDRLGPGADIVKLPDSNRLALAVRSKMLNRLVAGFIAAHPNAVVVELACGLETRMHRIAPPVTVDWYDNVIALRGELVPELDRTHLVAASLTNQAGWAAFRGIVRRSSSPTACSAF